ncbi:MAG: hypothetical protein ACE5K3_01265 [bacterium]
MWQCWLGFGAGLWLASAAISLSQFRWFNTVNDLAVGVVVIIFAVWSGISKRYPMWAAAGVSIWLIVSAWIPSIAASKPSHLLNGLIIGVVIMVFSAWSGAMKEKEEKKEEEKEEKKEKKEEEKK